MTRPPVSVSTKSTRSTQTRFAGLCVEIATLRSPHFVEARCAHSVSAVSVSAAKTAYRLRLLLFDPKQPLWESMDLHPLMNFFLFQTEAMLPFGEEEQANIGALPL